VPHLFLVVRQTNWRKISLFITKVKACREEEQLRSLRKTGDLVKFSGTIAIIVVMFIVVAASLISRSSVVAVMPDWSERQLAAMRR
jgi:hypothetical protein